MYIFFFFDYIEMCSITKRDLTFFISGILICLFIIWLLDYLNIEYASNPSDKKNINNRISFYKDSLKKLKITDLPSIQLALFFNYLSNITYDSKENINQLKFTSYGNLLNLEKTLDKDKLYKDCYNSFINKLTMVNTYLEPMNKISVGLTPKQRFAFAAGKIIKELNSSDKLIIKYLDKTNTLINLLDSKLTQSAKVTLAIGGTGIASKLFGISK